MLGGSADIAVHNLAVADRGGDTIGTRGVDARHGEDEKGQKQQTENAPVSAGRSFK
jgi:hypothetical protein